MLDQIEADLAIAGKGCVGRLYAKPAETKGRVTKGAVNALQTDVYLWRAKYKEAAAAAKKVIDNSYYFTGVGRQLVYDLLTKRTLPKAY